MFFHLPLQYALTASIGTVFVAPRHNHRCKAVRRASARAVDAPAQCVTRPIDTDCDEYLHTVKCASEHHGPRGDARTVPGGGATTRPVANGRLEPPKDRASDQRIVLLILDQLARFDTLGREVAQMLAGRPDLSLLAIQHDRERVVDNVIPSSTVGGVQAPSQPQALDCSDAIAVLDTAAQPFQCRIRSNIFVACRFVSLQPELGLRFCAAILTFANRCPCCFAACRVNIMRARMVVVMMMTMLPRLFLA